MKVLFASCILATAIAATAPTAYANDSQAAVAIGGLVLTKSEQIRMDSEDLYLSEKQVRVVYQFTNTSVQDIESLIAFPLPDYEPSPIAGVPDYARDLNFRTTVDGKPLDLTLVQTARFKGRDITARLKQLGIPIMPVPEVFDPAINRLPKAERDALVKEGLIDGGGTDGKQELWDPHWTVSTTVTRRQVFPAGKSIRVEHSYNPMPGGSVGGAFDTSYRKEKEFAEKRKTFCIDDETLRGIDGRIARLKEKSAYSEIWLKYVLKSGANWLGPIKDFRLVVDKGTPDAMVSFCAKGVKKIGPTQFEVRYSDFKPDRDLDVLLVKFGTN